MIIRLDIPASAFEVKAAFFDRPTKATVNLIHEHIKKTGCPHLWSGHTHDHPPKGSRVTFLGKYSLPKSHHAPENWAPCPCCSLHSPKYFRQGLIAWFPDEGVIRCVGDQCYKKMDPEGYALAMDQLNAEIADQVTADFLLGRIPHIPGFLRIIDENLPVAGAIDQMQALLSTTLEKTLDINLWPHVDAGLLQTTILRTEVKRGRGGREETQTIPDFQDYGRIEGHIALRRSGFKLRSRLERFRSNLDIINFGAEAEARIVKMTETEKKAASKILSFAHSQAIKCISQAAEIRRFFAKETASTINGWAAEEHSPVRVHLAIDDDGFYVGREAKSHIQLKWPEHFWKTLRTLEPLSKSIAA